MKKTMYLIAACLLGISLSLSACSKKIEVPAKVQSQFTKMFPDASKVKWSKESETEFEAEFRLAGEEASANFSMDGTWVETEKEISAKSLPSAVKNALDTQYKDYKTGEVAFTETAEGESFYEMELKKGKEEMIIHVSADGKVLKMETEEDEHNEEGEEGEE